MGATLPKVSVDSRPRAHKLSRRAALDILKARGVIVPNENIPLGTGVVDQDQSQPTILGLFASNGIDPNDPFPEMDWTNMEARNPDGSLIASTDLPVRKLHETAKHPVDYDQVMADRKQEQEANQKDELLKRQHDVIEQLQERLMLVEQQMKTAITPDRATIPQLKRLVKEAGHAIPKDAGKKDLLRILNGDSA